MTTSAIGTSHDILKFWFNTLKPVDWFKKSSKLDNTISRRFAATHAAASAGELHAWRDTPQGRLAEIIVLDQFSRNMFRDMVQAFAQDAQALALAQEALRNDADAQLQPNEQAFLYMPFMHSESSLIHEWASKLFSQPGLENQLKFEQRHKAIIDRFGRYPHRNAALGRKSSSEELAFLRQPGSSF